MKLAQYLEHIRQLKICWMHEWKQLLLFIKVTTCIRWYNSNHGSYYILGAHQVLGDVRCLTNTISFNPGATWWEASLILSPYYGWWNWDTDSLSDLLSRRFISVSAFQHICINSLSTQNLQRKSYILHNPGSDTFNLCNLAGKKNWMIIALIYIFDCCQRWTFSPFISSLVNFWLMCFVHWSIFPTDL